MTDDELLSEIRNEQSQSLGYMNGDLSAERETALQYYNGKLDVPALEGRSDYISTDVRDAVDGMLPDLLDVFLSSDDVVKFEPKGPEDEEPSKQATDAVNYVFYKQNNGALILYEWFKTALIEKNGVVKFWYENYSAPQIETYEGLNDVEFQMLVSQPNVTIIQHSAKPDETNPEMELHDVRARVQREGKICIEGVPSEEFLVSNDHRSLCLNDARFVEHRRKMTISQCRAMGYDVPDDAPDDISSPPEFSPEYQARRRYEEERTFEQTVDTGPNRKITFSEISMLVDFDDDGVAERRRVVKIGSKIYTNEDSDHVPFAAICPNIMPYRFMGLSIADVVADIQKIKSLVGRATIDSLYQALVPRIGVMESMVNLDDLLVSRPGGIIRFKTQPSMAMQPIEHKFVGQQAFPFMEYMDAVKENRTGFTRYSQGLDADSLNKTATGITAIQTAAGKRMKLVARMFAETGMKDLFRGILHLLAKYNSKPLVMRLRNKWTPVDPREWKTGWDMSVNVGLGTGDKGQQAAQLQNMMMIQGSMRQNGMEHIATDVNVYNAAKRLAESSGYKQEGEFFTPPDPNNPPQKPPPPEMMKIQAEQQQSQAELQASQQEKALEVQNAQAIARIQAETTIAVAQIKAAADKEIAMFKAQHEAQMTAMQCQHDDRKMEKEGEIRKEEATAKGAASGVRIKTPNANLKLPSAEESGAATAKAISETLVPVLQQFAQALQTMNAPKEVVRDAQGNIVGTRPAGTVH